MRRLRTRRPVAILGRNPGGRRHPEPRVLVGDDRRPALPQHLVRAGVLRVPVGVEHRPHATAGDNCRSDPPSADRVSSGAPLSTSTRPSAVESASTLVPPLVTSDSRSVSGTTAGAIAPDCAAAGPGCRAGRRRLPSGVVFDRASLSNGLGGVSMRQIPGRGRGLCGRWPSCGFVLHRHARSFCRRASSPASASGCAIRPKACPERPTARRI